MVILLMLLIPLLGTSNAEEWNYPEGLEFLGMLPPMQAGECSFKATGEKYFCILLLDLQDGTQYLTVWTTEKVLHEVVQMKTDGKFQIVYVEPKKIRF